MLHFQLAIGSRSDQVTVSEGALAVNPEQMTPTTIVSRDEIAMTPGADLSNSLTAITNYVPGAWMTHDQLHVRGGHQVTWAIDGVPIPNTNIASNIGPQIDPKDIDYLEAATRRLFLGLRGPDLWRVQRRAQNGFRAQ